MHLNNFSCISLASHYIFKMAAVTGCYESFINNILNSQLILIKFALKLFMCKCLSFQTHLLLDLRFPLSYASWCHIFVCDCGIYMVIYMIELHRECKC